MPFSLAVIVSLQAASKQPEHSGQRVNQTCQEGESFKLAFRMTYQELLDIISSACFSNYYFTSPFLLLKAQQT